jgi:hypothetical protein
MRSSLKLAAFTTLAAFAVAATGCGSDTRIQPNKPAEQPKNEPTSPPAVGPDGDMPKPSPAPSPPPAPKANYSGVYSVDAPLDFTQNGVLPGIVGPALASLAELHDHPGDAIVNILKNGNIPYLSSILQKVPDFLLAGLSGMLDNLIINNVYKTYKPVDQIANIIEGITEISKKMDLQNTVTVHKPASDGSITVDQQLTAVGFTFLNKSQVVPIPASALSRALAHAPAHITPHANAPVADADLSVDAGTFSLPVGSLMMEALGPLVFSNFGGATDLKGALVNVVPCADFGQTLSDDTSNFISQKEGQDLCEGGLGLVADIVNLEISKITLDNVQVDTITAKLYDVSMKVPTMDYQSDRLAEGKWTWHFAVAGGTAAVPSTFSGDRTGTTN